MRSMFFRRLVLIGAIFGFLGLSLPVFAIMGEHGTSAKLHHEKTKKVNQKIKSEIFSEWKGETLVTESGEYCISPSVKVYDYAHTRDGKQQYKHQPIVDLVYINHKLKRVIIRPCE